MSEHKVEDYKNKIVKVWDYGQEPLDLELLGECTTGGFIAINKDGMMEKFRHWEPLPEVKPITPLDLLVAGMYYYDRHHYCQSIVGSASSYYSKDKDLRFHKNPREPMENWKKFKDLTWDDLTSEKSS